MVYGPQLIGAAFVEELPIAPGGRMASRRVTHAGVEVNVMARPDLLERCGDSLFERLAERTGPAHLSGSAVFFDLDDRSSQTLRREFFLREFLKIPAQDSQELVLSWGPLDLAEHPRDLWRRKLSQGAHLTEIDYLLDASHRVHPEDGGAFPVDALAGDPLNVEGHAIGLQHLAFTVYQAAITTLVELALRDWPHSLRYGFDQRDLEATPRPPVTRAWQDRGLTPPPTVGEALDTTLSLLVRASRALSPRLEVHSDDPGDPPYWHMGTGILGAICLQAIHAVSDDAPVRPCKRCGQLFQRQRGDRPVEHRQGTVRVKFCSNRCARADAQKRYRERQRG